jgi:chromosome segregation ATPase
MTTDTIIELSQIIVEQRYYIDDLEYTLGKDNEFSKQTIAQLQDENNEIRKNLADALKNADFNGCLQQANDQLNQESNELRYERDNLQALVDKLEAEKQDLLSAIGLMESKLRDEICHLDNELDEYREERENLHNQIVRLQLEISGLQDRLRDCTAQQNHLNTLLDDRERSCDGLREANDSLSNEISRLQPLVDHVVMDRAELLRFALLNPEVFSMCVQKLRSADPLNSENKLASIKLIREISRLGLKEAKGLYEAFWSIVPPPVVEPTLF